MVKAKNKELNMFDFVKSMYNTKILTRKFKTFALASYCAVLLLVLTTLSLVFVNLKGIGTLSDQLLVSLLGVPLLLLAVYVLFYLFISAFEDKSQTFWKGFFVFSSILLHYIIIGNLLTNLTYIFFSPTLISFLGVLLGMIIIYFIFNLILNLKNYYKTSWQRILVSFLLVDIIFAVLITLQYFTMILSSLG